MDDAADLIRAVSTALWPVVAIVVVLRLLPELRKRLRSSDVNVKFGQVEVSLQDASDSLRRQVKDLQEALEALRGGGKAEGSPAPRVTTRSGFGTRSLPGAAAPARPTADGAAHRAVLWVDDNPANNAFEVAKLQEDGLPVHQATSTAEALGILADRAVDVVVTDVSRQEGAGRRSDAAAELMREIERRGDPVPVVVYGAADAVALARPALIEAGAAAVTSSPMELFAELRSLGFDV